MDKEKQIEEMAKAIEQARIKATDTTNSMNYGFGGWYAKELYAKGYRKASELAEEIFEEIERYLRLNEDIAIKCKEENGEQNREYFKGKLVAYLQIRGFVDVELKRQYKEGRK